MWSQLARDCLQGRVTYKSGSSLDYAFVDPRVEILSRLQHQAYDQVAALDSGVYRMAARLRRNGDMDAWRSHRAAGVASNTRFFERLLSLAEVGTLSPDSHRRALTNHIEGLRDLAGPMAA